MSSGGLDAAGDVVQVGAHRLPSLGDERRAELGDGVRARRIETLPLELVGPEGRQEGVFAVLREFGIVAIIPARLRVAHVAETGREALADGSMGGRGSLEVATADEIGDEQDREQRREQHGEVAPARCDVSSSAFVPAADEAQTAPQQEEPRRDGEHDRDDQRKVIGLLDILQHLGRVDEVVDRDEVEADAELFPEEDFRDLPEREEERAEDPGRAERQS